MCVPHYAPDLLVRKRLRQPLRLVKPNWLAMNRGGPQIVLPRYPPTRATCRMWPQHV